MYSLVSRHKVDLVREDHSTYVAKDVTFILENGYNFSPGKILSELNSDDVPAVLQKGTKFFLMQSTEQQRCSPLRLMCCAMSNDEQYSTELVLLNDVQITDSNGVYIPHSILQFQTSSFIHVMVTWSKSQCVAKRYFNKLKSESVLNKVDIVLIVRTAGTTMFSLPSKKQDIVELCICSAGITPQQLTPVCEDLKMLVGSNSQIIEIDSNNCPLLNSLQ